MTAVVPNFDSTVVTSSHNSVTQHINAVYIIFVASERPYFVKIVCVPYHTLLVCAGCEQLSRVGGPLQIENHILVPLAHAQILTPIENVPKVNLAILACRSDEASALAKPGAVDFATVALQLKGWRGQASLFLGGYVH